MIAHPLFLLQLAGAVSAAPAPQHDGVVLDAVLGAPVADAVVRSSLELTRTGPEGLFRIAARAPLDTLRITRLGYREAVVILRAGDGGNVRVLLLRAAVPLAAVEVRAERAARASQSRAAEAVRSQGATSAAQLASSLPFVSARATSARTALSVRGSRAEQVLVTLDGMPLNDPATGIADPSDIPLAAIATATVVPGSDAARFGSGATGGVVAFNSSDREVLAASAGSYGARSVQAAWPARLGSVTVRTGAAWSTAGNDFEFRNVAAAPPADTIERRVNADVTRASLFTSVLAPRVQLLALATDSERGLAGPMNARDYEDDRGRTRRALVRARTGGAYWELVAGARRLRSEFRDPAGVFDDARVDASSADAELGASAYGFAVRAGGGVDRVSGTTLASASRPRIFAQVAREHVWRGLLVDAAARVDAVRGGGTHLSPSLALATTGDVSVTARAARGFRIPTFFDLYLSTPQRAFARELEPERVTADLELRVDGTHALRPAALRWGASVFSRRTEDAIVWFPGNVGWSPHNVPVERVRGLELHAAADAACWKLDGWSAVYDARLWDGFLETRTPYVPYVTGGGDATLRHRAVVLGVHFRVTGRRPFVNGPAAPELELPAAAVLGVSLAQSVALGPTSVMLHLGVHDLANTRAEEVRRHPAPGRTVSAGFVLQPRSRP